MEATIKTIRIIATQLVTATVTKFYVTPSVLPRTDAVYRNDGLRFTTAQQYVLHFQWR